MHALGNLPEPVLRFDICKVDNLCSKTRIFRDISFVKLTWNDLA